jgi:hypothetical protein
MKNELEITNKGKSIIMRNGIEILIEDEIAKRIEDILINIKEHKFLRIGSRTINTADLVGVFELTDKK